MLGHILRRISARITNAQDAGRIARCLRSQSPRPFGGIEPLESRLLLSAAPVLENDFAEIAEDTMTLIDVLANDSDPDGDPLTLVDVQFDFGTSGNGIIDEGTMVIEGNQLKYTPAADFFGDVTFTYTAEDSNAEQSTASVTVVITNVNDNPNAVNDTVFGVLEDSLLADNLIDVLANDKRAPDVNETLTITAVDGVSANGGTVVNVGGTAVRYQPAADFFGIDTFTYTIGDGNGGFDTATVTVNVTGSQDNPIANDDAYEAVANVPLVIDAGGGVLVNDVEPDGEALTATVETGPSNGVLQLNDDGSFTYTPNTDFFGLDSFTYMISDGNGGFDSALVTINVLSVDEYVQTILDKIEMIEDDGDINGGLANALSVKLLGALSMLDRDKDDVAIKRIESFINHVEGLVNGSVLDEADGLSLIACAQTALQSIAS